MIRPDLAPLVLAGDWQRVIDSTRGGNDHGDSILWCAALTALHGPGNVHPSYCDRGRPDPERCNFPRVWEAIVAAEDRLRWYVLGVRP